jgi:hypothetical protein
MENKQILPNIFLDKTIEIYGKIRDFFWLFLLAY